MLGRSAAISGNFGWSRKLEADLALDDLAQRCVFSRKFLERFDQREVPAFQLLDAPRQHVDEHIGIVDHQQRRSDIIVSHRWNHSRLIDATTRSASTNSDQTGLSSRS